VTCPSAFPQDAITAVEKFQGKELAGRKLILEIAVFSGQTTKAEKDALAGAAAATASKTKPDPETVLDAVAPAQPNPTIALGSSPSLQVVVCGVPSHLNKKAFKEIVQSVHRCPKLVVELLKEVSLPPPLSLPLSTHSVMTAGPSAVSTSARCGRPTREGHAPLDTGQTRRRHSRLQTRQRHTKVYWHH
jgi:RNA recognition motif-containing protein